MVGNMYPMIYTSPSSITTGTIVVGDRCIVGGNSAVLPNCVLEPRSSIGDIRIVTLFNSGHVTTVTHYGLIQCLFTLNATV